MRRPPTDPYAPLRRELAELGYTTGQADRVVDYHERHGTFRGYPVLDRLGQLHAELIIESGWPMATRERVK